ncbi:hypothetical protein K523DRAFT_226838 [Schizophyllum commune Tattone D]|nr:hypothetical protein K523DRAFT_226838 [Schizophyllum commune Tattone D]
MNRPFRRDGGGDYFPNPGPARPLRLVASGTLFLTYHLALPSHPAPAAAVRAHAVRKSRGGSASSILAVAAQLPSVDAQLIAPLSGNEEGRAIARELERERVGTRFCKIWKAAGVPTAWVLHAADTDTHSVINHNPLPEISHEDFVSLLGPVLAPENYNYPPTPSPSASPTFVAHAHAPPPPASPRPSASSSRAGPLPNPNSPAPFEWIHFEGRSVKTTLNNITGLDGLARERKWRNHCVFSIDVGQRGRQGVEALIPHADVIFLSKNYARAAGAQYAATPRAFLLSLTSVAPPHALLVAHWGTEGAAALSMPTREYFQSSGWVEDARLASGARRPDSLVTEDALLDIQSVRSANDFWADGHSNSDQTFSDRTTTPASSRRRQRRDESDADSQGTAMPGEEGEDILDEAGAHDAFIAGMIYALTRRLMPGAPYSPASGDMTAKEAAEAERGRWRLDECLRFATELSGRKARRHDWAGLGEEMALSGWFEG